MAAKTKIVLSDTVKIAIIAGFVTLGQAWIATRVERVNNKVDRVETKVDTVHNVVNHKMDTMLQLVKEKSTAEGVLTGKAQQVTEDSLDKKK